MNTNAVLDLTTGDLLELHQILKTPETELWRYGAFNELARLSQGGKKRTVKGIYTIHFISPNQKPTKKKQPLLKLLSANDHRNNTLSDFKSLLEVTKSTM